MYKSYRNILLFCHRYDMMRAVKMIKTTGGFCFETAFYCDPMLQFRSLYG